MYSLWEMIFAPLCHFVFSAALGSLAYIAIMAVFNRYCFPHMDAKDITRIKLLALCFCLAIAVMAHVIEDYTIDWF